jgi:amidase
LGEQAPVDVIELDVAAARDRMASGTLTARALTEGYLKRIAEIDDAGPTLNAVMDINPEALDDADRLDAERKGGKVRSELHGIPVLVKDNIDVAGMVNSAGSLALAGHRPREDAFIVTRLRAAGAIILGRTNLTEWANFRAFSGLAGWSSRGGLTRNPYVLDRTACGSSSGTGAAIAASLAAVGVGTDSGGSVICPAAVNGLVGLKPTIGLVSRAGIIPGLPKRDTAGPMGRTVRDVAMLMNALAAADATDPLVRDAAKHIPRDYASGLRVTSLRGLRLGVLPNKGLHADVDRVFESAAETVKQQGAELIDVKVSFLYSFSRHDITIWAYEMHSALNKYLKESNAPQSDLAAIVAWNKEHAQQAMPLFGQERFELAVSKSSLDAEEYVNARREHPDFDSALPAALAANHLDAIIAPTIWPAWPIYEDNPKHPLWPLGYGLAAAAGTPSITVPMGDSRGLPLGLVFMAGAYREADLLSWAFSFEQATKARRPPLFLSTSSQ